MVQNDECHHRKGHSIDERLYVIWRRKENTAPFFLRLSDIWKVNGEIQEETSENAEGEKSEMNGLSRIGVVLIVLHSEQSALSNMIFEFTAKEENDQRHVLYHFLHDC